MVLPADSGLITALNNSDGFFLRLYMDRGRSDERTYAFTNISIDAANREISGELTWQGLPPGDHDFELEYVVVIGGEEIVIARVKRSNVTIKAGANELSFIDEAAANRGLDYPDDDRDGRNNLDEINQHWNPRLANPAAPGNLRVTPLFRALQLEWDPVAGAADYVIYLATQTGVLTANCAAPLCERFANVTATTTTLSATTGSPAGLSSDLIYYVVVTARNANGESLESAEVYGRSLGEPFYYVNGTVNGLEPGRNVILRNNGGDELTVAANIDFTFATALAGGDAYAVTVARQPAGGGCEVRNGSGTVQSGAVIGVAVICRYWHAADTISAGDGDAGQAQISLDGSGNAWAIWHQSDGMRLNIVANYFKIGGGWGTADLIEHDDLGDAWDAQISFDASGNTMAVWDQWDGSRYNIVAGHQDAGGTWVEPELVEHDDAADAWAPQIVFDAGGNAITVWIQSDGQRSNILASRHSPGGVWESALPLEQGDGGVWPPRIAIDAAGNVAAIWAQWDLTAKTSRIWANRFDAGAGGGWQSAIQLSNGDSGEANDPRIAVDNKGNVLAIWSQWNGQRKNIWIARYPVDGAWGAAKLLELDDTGDADNPEAAFDINGNALAVWSQSDGKNITIRASRLTADGRWQLPEIINNDNGDPAAFPRLAFDSRGNALTVWSQSAGGRGDIWANRYSANGGGWGEPTLIEHDDGDATLPTIAVDAAGNALALWHQSVGAQVAIRANRFE